MIAKAVGVPLLLLLALPVRVAADDAPRHAVDIPAGPLIACLEALAATAGVRIVDAAGVVPDRRCERVRGTLTLPAALDRLLRPAGLAWTRRDDGTIAVVDAGVPSAPVELPPLDVEGMEPLPIERTKPGGAPPTALADASTAVTRVEKPWLETAPLISFDQIGRYAPNVYSSGTSLSIRGIERDTDFFTALRVTLDGIDLGTRLLDDDFVPVDALARIELVRGPRSFEAGEAAFGGLVRLETDDPTLEPSLEAHGGLGDVGDWRAGVVASGPLGGGFDGTIGVTRRAVPSFVTQLNVPEATRRRPVRDALRMKLRFEPDALPEFSAQLAALSVDGEGAERAVEAPSVGADAFDPYRRESFALRPRTTQTQATGAAVRASYALSPRNALAVHASTISVARTDRVLPSPDLVGGSSEKRRRWGVEWRSAFSDWGTLVVDYTETTDLTGSTFTVYTPFRPRLNNQPLDVAPETRLLTFRGAAFDVRANTLLAYYEHRFGEHWTAGIGARLLREDVTNRETAEHRLTARCRVRRPGTGEDLGDCNRFLGPAQPFDPDGLFRRGEVRESTPIPLGTVEWRPNAAHSLVLSYGRGHRTPGSTSPTVHYAPERSTHVELNWRATWLDGALRTNTTLFDARIRDRFTYPRFDGTGGNEGRAHSYGVELEAEAQLSDVWRVRGAVGLLDAKYEQFDYGAGVELGGLPLAGAPSFTYVLGARWGRPDGWYASLDAYRAGAAESGLYNLEFVRRGPYTILDARAGYRADRWEASLSVGNVLDQDYIVRSEVPVQFAIPTTTRLRLGDPRRVEVRFSYSF